MKIGFIDKLKNELYRARLAVFVVFAFCMGAVFAFLATSNTANTNATTAGFRAGNIITDYVMSNSNTMSVADIQNFLSRKNPCNYRDYNKYVSLMNSNAAKKGYSWHWDNGHFVCLSEEKFDGESAAQIIYNAAQDYHINPQVLIVLLEKEQGLITDKYPNNVQYRSATGYGCPDTAACDTKYYGFKNQVRNAASLFHQVLTGGWSNYHVGNNQVAYHPNGACGSSTVYIENLATAALYRYTPYQPNNAALNWSSDGCSSYGNRNFYHYFTEWFGSTQQTGWVKLDTPRYFELTQDTRRINPFTGQIADDSPIAKGTILFYTSKSTYNGHLCMRTEHNTNNDINACVPMSSLKELELTYQDVPEDEQYKIINPNSVKTILATKKSEKYSTPMIRRFPKKVTFMGKVYYLTEFDSLLVDGFVGGFTLDSLTNIIYEPISEYFVVGSNGAKKLDLFSNREQILDFGTTRLYKAKIILNGKTYYQTEFDYNNNNSAYLVDGDGFAAVDAVYIPFENPRAMKVTRNTDRINPVTNRYYDTLSAGQVVDFAQKTYINGSWYYQTKHNARFGIPAAIPASATAEL